MLAPFARSRESVCFCSSDEEIEGCLQVGWILTTKRYFVDDHYGALKRCAFKDGRIWLEIPLDFYMGLLFTCLTQVHRFKYKGGCNA